MALNVETLAGQMLAAALPILKRDAQNAEDFAKAEFTKIAETIVSIAKGIASGEITQQQAGPLLNMQKTASQNVLLTIKGLALLAIENAINAALGVVKTAVNTALGFALIG